MNSRALIFLLTLLTALYTWAGEFTYGPEFEFEHKSITSDWERGGKVQAAKAKLLYVQNITEICKTLGCSVTKVEGKWLEMIDKNQGADYKVTFEDGWWFKISHDPGCVEITAKPSTQKELNDRKKLLDYIIFNSGKKLGFYIPDGDAAHFNIGFMRAFENNGEHFLRFFVDYHNRPELALGALGHDIYNGPPLSVLGKKQRDALVQIVADQQILPMDALEIANRIENEVYTRPYLLSWGGAEHYQMIGLKMINRALRSQMKKQDRPFELRAIWAQKNMSQFILLAELFEARINYLKTLTAPIVYTQSTKKEFSNIEQAAGFYNYLTETGLSYQKFKKLLPDDLQNIDLKLIKAKAEKMKLDLPQSTPGRCATLFAS